MMMLKILLPIILILILVESVSAQYKKISLDVNNKSVAEILSIIEHQADIAFSYESSLLDNISNKTIKIQNESLSVCLDKLFQGTSIEYKISGKHVILKKKEKNLTISGYIYDLSSKETLIGASVFDKNSNKGTGTNNYGFYSLTLPEGNVALNVSYVGYGTRELSFALSKDTICSHFLRLTTLLKEIVIEGKQNALSNVRNTQLGTLNFSSATINNIPAILSEVDMLKAIQQTPGVVVGVEGFSGLYVRGGNKDENLFLVDGIPLYDVNHLLGFVSTFNPDAIKNTDFYKGSFPARYSGRLSSVVDVRIKDGDMKEYHGSFTIGLLSAKAQLEGPIIKDRTSFNLSYRRTYLDLLAIPVFKRISKSNSHDNYKEEVVVGYHFYDLNAKINHKFSDKSRIYLSVYNGEDAAKTQEKTTDDTYSYNSSTGEKQNYQFSIYENYLLKWKWGNFLTSFNWNYIFNNKLFGNASLIYTKYGSYINMLEESLKYNTETDLTTGENYRKTTYNSQIQDWGYRLDFDYIPSPKHTVKFGSNYLYHTFCPEESGIRSKYKYDEIAQSDTMQFLDNKIYANELSLYAEDDIEITSKIKANLGLNISLFNVQGKTYTSLQPRISARYLLNDNFSVKASYAKMNQYVHLLSASYLSMPNDLWVPVTDNVRPMSSQQVSAGLYYNLNQEWDFSLEGYYKRMDNLIEYKDGASLFSPSADWQQKIAIGNGRAYGMEFLLQRKLGKTTGWLSYTLSWSDRQFPYGEINFGERFYSKYDNRHKINIVLQHKLSKAIDFNVSWTYFTGNRMTLPLEEYQTEPGLGTDDSQDNWYPYIDKRYNYKMGDYHRMDLGFNFYRYKKKNRMGIWNVSIYNAYCRLNPFFVRPETRIYLVEEPDGSTKEYFQSKLKKVTIFPFIPSVSYTYKF